MSNSPDAPQGVTAAETGRNLVITTDYGSYVVQPLAARKGALLLQQLLGISFGNGAVPEAAEQIEMFNNALGPELYEQLQDELRLSEVTPIALIALYWQTVGMEAVNAYLMGGPGKAVEVLAKLISPMGLSQPTTSSSLAAAVTTPRPGDTNGTFTRPDGEKP